MFNAFSRLAGDLENSHAGAHRVDVVERNLCVNNGGSPRLAQLQGAFFIYTWNNGIIENLRVEKNSIYWSPPGNFPALINRADIQGAQKIFRENQIYSRSANMIEGKNNMIFGDNRYTTCSVGKAAWMFDGRAYSAFDDYRKGSKQEEGSSWKAERVSDACLDRQTTAVAQNWSLQCELPLSLDGYGLLDFAAGGQLTILKNLEKQFGRGGLAIKVTLIFDSPDAIQTQNLVRDIGLRNIESMQSKGSGASKNPRIRLLAAGGSVAKEWQSFVGPAEIGFAIRRALGRPDFSRMDKLD